MNFSELFEGEPAKRVHGGENIFVLTALTTLIMGGGGAHIVTLYISLLDLFYLYLKGLAALML